MVEFVAVAGEIGRIGAGDDIEQRTSAGNAVERRGMAGKHRRCAAVRTQRHQEAQALREWRKGGGGDPGILAALAGRQEDALEAEPVGGLGDLTHIAERAGTLALVAAEIGAIAMGRQIPIDVERVLGHRRNPLETRG